MSHEQNRIDREQLPSDYRLGGLTELADPEGLPVSETAAAKLHQLNQAAMSMVRSRLSSI